MIETNELMKEGMVEDITIKKGSKGEFLKIKLNGMTFNFFDMEYYEKNKALFRTDVPCTIVYYDSEYEKNGTKYTSHVAKAVAFEKNEGTSQPASLETRTETARHRKETDIELYERCLNEAIDLCRKVEASKGIEFPPEAMKDVGTSLFIKRTRG